MTLFISSLFLSASLLSWKEAGEYFETRYLTSLQQQKRVPEYLALARQIYQDHDANHFESMTQTPLYKTWEKIRCEVASDALWGKKGERVLAEVERYALRGYSDCIDSMARWKKPAYWNHRVKVASDEALNAIWNADLINLTKVEIDVPKMLINALSEDIEPSTRLQIANLALKYRRAGEGDDQLREFASTYSDVSEIKKLNSTPLSMLFFKPVFGDDVRHFEHTMNLEDIYQTLGLSSGRAPAIAQAVQAYVEPITIDDKDSLFAEGMSVVRRFRHALQNYAQTKKFFFWNWTLENAFSEYRLSAIKSIFERKLQLLSNLIEVRANRQFSEQSVRNAIELKEQELEKWVAEYLATQRALDEHLKVVVDNQELRVSQYVMGRSSAFMVSPRDERRVGTLQANEMLTIKVLGEWSPVCALLKAGNISDASDVRVGPEGFRIHLSKTDSTTSGDDERMTDSKFSQETNTRAYSVDWLKAIGIGLAAVVGTIILPGAGTILGLGIGATATSPFSASDASQSTSGTSHNFDKSSFYQSSKTKSQVAVFQSGLRLPHAPFPQMPVGAYLAIVVSTEGDDKGQVVDAFVLQAQSVYVAPKNVEIHFVVNDCLYAGSTGVLSVQWQKYLPANFQAQKWMTQMREQLQVFAARGEALIVEGGDLSSRIETLKTGVIAQLHQSSDADFMTEPALRSRFFHMLAYEADKIVRGARLVELGRQIKMVETELNGLRRLIDSDDKPLEDAQNDVVQYAALNVSPWLHLYPLKDVFPVQPSNVMGNEVKALGERLLGGIEQIWSSDVSYEYAMARLPLQPGEVPSGIISDMALVVVHDPRVESEYLRSQFAGAKLQINWDKQQRFTTPFGVKTFVLGSDKLQQQTISVGFANAEDWKREAIPDLNAGKGLSSLGNFTLSGSVIDDIKKTLGVSNLDVYVVMKVMVRK